MADLVHNFGARKRKRGATPEVAGGADQHPFDENSDVQAIVVLDSPEMGFHGQLVSETAFLVDLGEVSLVHAEVQEDIPSEQIASQSDKATSTLAGRSRPLHPNWLLLNSYIPPQG